LADFVDAIYIYIYNVRFFSLLGTATHVNRKQGIFFSVSSIWYLVSVIKFPCKKKFRKIVEFAGLFGTVIRVRIMQSCVEDCTSLAYHYDTQRTLLLLSHMLQNLCRTTRHFQKYYYYYYY